MKPTLGAVLATCLCAAAAQAATVPPPMAGLAFLQGSWSGGRGQVAATGDAITGTSIFTAEAGGAVLLRRDHSIVLNTPGKPAAAFDQIMMIYAEGGQIRAEYADGSHLLHYVATSIMPNHAVTFTSTAAPGAPVFKLTYTLPDPKTLAVKFVMIPPGGGPERPIATGTLTREKNVSPNKR